jgi:hypothetical protein
MKRRELLSGLAAVALASGCASQEPSRLQRLKTPQARYGRKGGVFVIAAMTVAPAHWETCHELS